MTAPLTPSDSAPAQRTPKSLRDHLRALLGAAVLVFSPLLMLEGLLRLFDPWGMRYFDDLSYMGNQLFEYDEARGFSIDDGDYQLARWSFSLRDSGRLVPASPSQAPCTLTVLGDSVAFGYGVEDSQTWVNLLAQGFPNVRVRNVALPRYNSTNVLQNFQHFAGDDIYFYLLVNNDLENALDMRTMRFVGGGDNLPFLARYLNYAVYRGGGTTYIPAAKGNSAQVGDTPEARRLVSEVQALSEAGVRIAAFEYENVTNTLLAQGIPLDLLSYPPYAVSFVDDHLNPQGNYELAKQILPIWQALVAEKCPTA